MRKGEDYTGVTIVFACHDGEGNFLLSMRGEGSRDEHGTWDPGGGSLEFGDTVENTLRKEIEEEYCTDVLDYEFLGWRDVHRVNGNKKTHWIALDFKVLVDRAKAGNGEPHKLDAVEWFRLDKLPHRSLLHSQFPHFLDLYWQKLVGA